MDKLYLNVCVSGINKSYDIVVSPELKVKTAADYIFKTISEYEELSVDCENLILCSKQNKTILDGNLTLSQCGIKDGGELILV